MILPSRPHRRIMVYGSALVWACLLAGPSLRAADKKTEPWTEVRTSHFVVASDGGEKTAHRIAEQFEQVRRVIQSVMPHARTDTSVPIRILAPKDNKSFAALLPEYPESDIRRQPAGLFVAGEERTYIVIRAKASGNAPYREVVRQYAHLVLNLTYRSLPPWLEEGFSNVFGSMTFSDKGARMGRPDPEDMSVLWMSPLLPLHIIFGAGHNSPYYNRSNTKTMFFAESRALVHFLIADPRLSGSKALDRYVAAVESGTNSLQAAKQTFGNLDRMRDNLEAYIKAISPQPTEIPLAGAADSIPSGRTLSHAETDALLGDFGLARGELGPARTKLEDAVRLDPSLAAAHESLGFLALREEHYADADKDFQRAAQLDPHSALTVYGQALLLIARTGSVGIPLGAVSLLERTVSLQPAFAPAWSRLASIYGQTRQTLKRALAAAQHATTLVPGNERYQTQLAEIQAQLAQPPQHDEANGAAGQASASEVASFSNGPLLLENKTQPASEAPAEIPSPASRVSVPKPVAAPPSVPAESSRVFSMFGTITQASCANPPQVLITLKFQMIVLHLHSSDIGQVTFDGKGLRSGDKRVACRTLRGRSARVSYHPTQGTKWDGEIKAIEFRDGL